MVEYNIDGPTMRSVSEWLGDTKNAQILEILVMAAVFDPDEKCRKIAISGISHRVPSKIKVNRGFTGDNSIFIEAQQGDIYEILYVCESPKEYAQEKAVAHPFDVSFS
jgi:hypothetical protein